MPLPVLPILEDYRVFITRLIRHRVEFQLLGPRDIVCHLQQNKSMKRLLADYHRKPESNYLFQNLELDRFGGRSLRRRVVVLRFL